MREQTQNKVEVCDIKGAASSLGEGIQSNNFNIYSINQVLMHSFPITE